MSKRMHRGFFAEKYLSNKKQDQNNEFLACGHFIESVDYFERERINMIKEFNTGQIKEELYVTANREDLC